MRVASKFPISLIALICGLILCPSHPILGLEIQGPKNVGNNYMGMDFYFFRSLNSDAKDVELDAEGPENVDFQGEKEQSVSMKVDEYNNDFKNHLKSSRDAEIGINSIPLFKNLAIQNSEIGPGNDVDKFKMNGYETRDHKEKLGLFGEGVLEDVEMNTGSVEIVYTAAVVEFEAYRDWTDGGSEEIYKKNVHSFEFYATQAKLMGVDIIVFPEYGLEGLDHGTRNDSVFQALTVPVPAPAAKVAPCDYDVEVCFDPVQKLSCLARRLKMYLVVDLAERAETCHEDGDASDIYYNTQVVFDRSGVVVARYRKRHLFAEPKFQPGPDDNDSALFTSDFGVTFSLQICFDILFSEPSYANVQRGLTRDIITSTAWIDHAPFNMAPNVQSGFSRSLGVNLLVANYHWPELGKLGSGVYHGYSDLSNVYTYDEHSGNVLVVSPVRTRLSAPPQRVPRAFLSKPKVFKYRRSTDASREHMLEASNENLMKSSDILTTTLPHAQHQNHASVCFRDLCCDLNYYYFSTNELIYRLVAFNGYYPAGNRLLYVQVCGLLWCANTDMKSCAILEPKPETSSDFFGPFTLSGNFTSDLTFPGAMRRNSTLVPNKLYGFKEKSDGYSEIEFKTGALNLAMAYVIGRKYSADLPSGDA